MHNYLCEGSRIRVAKDFSYRVYQHNSLVAVFGGLEAHTSHHKCCKW